MSRLKSVLLVDFDNIYAATSDEVVTGLSKWLLWLEDGAFAPKNRRRRFIEKRIYWNPHFDTYRPDFERQGFAVFNCPALARRKSNSGKSSADIVMTMDAVEIALTNPDVQEVIILSTDSDFVSVVNRIQDDKLKVVTCGKETDPTYELFSNYADAVIHIAALKAGFGYERVKRKWYRFRSPPPEIAPLTLLNERRSMLMGRVRMAMAANDGPREGPPPELLRAAKLVKEVGERVPDQLISRTRIIKTLSAIPEFSVSSRAGQKAWFGYKNYAAMMRRLSQLQQGIELVLVTKNKVEVVWREPVNPDAKRPSSEEEDGPDPRLVVEGQAPFSLTEHLEAEETRIEQRAPIALLTRQPLGLVTNEMPEPEEPEAPETVEFEAFEDEFDEAEAEEVSDETEALEEAEDEDVERIGRA